MVSSINFQSCALLESLIEIQLYGTTYAYPSTQEWNWWNANWNDYANIYIPQNSHWYGNIYAPLPIGYRNPVLQNCTFNPAGTRCYLTLHCDDNRILNYVFGWKGNNYVRWY